MKLSQLLQILTFAILTYTQVLANEPTTESSNNDVVDSGKSNIAEAVTLYQDAMSAIKGEDWETASTHLKSILAQYPNSPMPYIGFGKFHYAREEYVSAEQALLKGLEIAPQHTELLYEYSRVLLMGGNIPLAIVQADQVVQNANAKWQHFYWLHFLLKSNNERGIAKIYLEIALEKLILDIEYLASTKKKMDSDSSEAFEEKMTELLSKKVSLNEELLAWE